MLPLQRRPMISIIALCICVLVLVSNNLASETPGRYAESIKNDRARYQRMVERIQWGANQPPPKKRMVLEEPIMQETREENDPAIGERDPPTHNISGSAKLPMYAARDYGIGIYFVDLEIGVPPKKLRMLVDTGSEFTWVKCSKDQNTPLPDGRGLVAAESSTFHAIGCDTNFCNDEFSKLARLDVCPSPAAPCMFNYSYGINAETMTYGIFCKETVTLPTTTNTSAILPNILIGCSESYYGKADIKEADGFLGLGIGFYSFSLHAVNLFGGSFQYCLVDHLSHANESSYLVFGDDRQKAPTYGYMRYTALRTDISENPYLWVNVKGVSIGGKMLDIPPLVWFSEIGGTILDTGTAATYWVEPAYRAIMDELTAFLAKAHPKVPEYSGDGSLDFEYCFNTTATPLDPTTVPRLEIHFTDGARFKPHVKSYILDDRPEVKCVGFLQAVGGMHIIGNILQQNYLWEFDLHHSMVGFSPSTCT